MLDIVLFAKLVLVALSDSDEEVLVMTVVVERDECDELVVVEEGTPVEEVVIDVGGLFVPLVVLPPGMRLKVSKAAIDTATIAATRMITVNNAETPKRFFLSRGPLSIIFFIDSRYFLLFLFPLHWS